MSAGQKPGPITGFRVARHDSREPAGDSEMRGHVGSSASILRAGWSP